MGFVEAPSNPLQCSSESLVEYIFCGNITYLTNVAFQLGVQPFIQLLIDLKDLNESLSPNLRAAVSDKVHRIPAMHMLGRYSFATNDDWITRILQRQIDLLREGGRHLEADHLCEAAGIQLRYNHDLMDRILP